MPTYKFDPEIKGMILKSEYEDKYGKEPKRSHQVMPDIEAFVSPIDKTVITSRPHLNAHNEKHGVTNIADYSAEHFEEGGKQLAKNARGQTAQDKKERLEVIDKTLTHYGA